MDLIIHFIKQYKVPFAFAGLGALLIFLSVFFPQGKKKPDIIFTSDESSVSAELISLITVDIAGEVANPGVYSVPATSRVNDLLAKAGGITSEADTEWIGKHLNRAQLLHDGDKLYIPSINDVKDNNSITNNIQEDSISNKKININTAPQTELEELPGIGEKTAVKIIENRPYQSATDLRTKKIVGESVFTKIENLISTL